MKEESVYRNKCPVCNKDRIYKTKCGYLRADRLKLPCRSCANSLSRGGLGILYKDDNKRCSSCKEYKPLDDFFTRSYGNKYPNCKSCTKLLSKEYSKNIYRFTKYNIDKETYDNLLFEQNGKCKICNINTNLHIDHCHKSGKVRGLLCGNCNKALGLMRDSVESLKEAIKYLEINE